MALPVFVPKKDTLVVVEEVVLVLVAEVRTVGSTTVVVGAGALAAGSTEEAETPPPLLLLLLLPPSEDKAEAETEVDNTPAVEDTLLPGTPLPASAEEVAVVAEEVEVVVVALPLLARRSTCPLPTLFKLNMKLL